MVAPALPFGITLAQAAIPVIGSGLLYGKHKLESRDDKQFYETRERNKRAIAQANLLSMLGNRNVTPDIEQHRPDALTRTGFSALNLASQIPSYIQMYQQQQDRKDLLADRELARKDRLLARADAEEQRKINRYNFEKQQGIDTARGIPIRDVKDPFGAQLDRATGRGQFARTPLPKTEMPEQFLRALGRPKDSSGMGLKPPQITDLPSRESLVSNVEEPQQNLVNNLLKLSKRPGDEGYRGDFQKMGGRLGEMTPSLPYGQTPELGQFQELRAEDYTDNPTPAFVNAFNAEVNDRRLKLTAREKQIRIEDLQLEKLNLEIEAAIRKGEKLNFDDLSKRAGASGRNLARKFPTMSRENILKVLAVELHPDLVNNAEIHTFIIDEFEKQQDVYRKDMISTIDEASKMVREIGLPSALAYLEERLGVDKGLVADEGIRTAFIDRMTKQLTDIAMLPDLTATQKTEVANRLSARATAQRALDKLSDPEFFSSLQDKFGAGFTGRVSEAKETFQGRRDALGEEAADLLIDLGFAYDIVARMRTGAAIQEYEKEFYEKVVGSVTSDPQDLRDQLQTLVEQMDTEINSILIVDLMGRGAYKEPEPTPPTPLSGRKRFDFSPISQRPGFGLLRDLGQFSLSGDG